MGKAKLNKKEQAWLERFQKTMAAAPNSLRSKVWAYTVGDDNITLYDRVKCDAYFDSNPVDHRSNDDHCDLVLLADTEMVHIEFPFPIESTAG